MGATVDEGYHVIPTCAIGASDGSSAALKEIFRQVPDDPGPAHMVVILISPYRLKWPSGGLSEIASMPAQKIREAEILVPYCVYVVPPEKEPYSKRNNATARLFKGLRRHSESVDVLSRIPATSRGDGLAVTLFYADADSAGDVNAVKERASSCSCGCRRKPNVGSPKPPRSRPPTSCRSHALSSD